MINYEQEYGLTIFVGICKVLKINNIEKNYEKIKDK